MIAAKFILLFFAWVICDGGFLAAFSRRACNSATMLSASGSVCTVLDWAVSGIGRVKVYPAVCGGVFNDVAQIPVLIF